MAMAVHLLTLIIFLSVFSLVFAQSRIRCHPSENDTLSRIQFFKPIAEDGVPDCCSWSSVQCDNATDHVIGLHLYESANNNTLSPHSPIFQLRHLRKLSVDGCIYIENRCEIPNEIEKLTVLEELSLGSYSGPVPSSIGNLKQLKMLSISHHLNTSIPDSIGNLRNLTSLTLYDMEWNGSIPASIGNLHKLTKLEIYINYGLGGLIPDSIGNLRNLIFLTLAESEISGSIPTSIGNLHKLTSLRLRRNKLRGSIPASIGNLRNLTSLYLDANELTGSIPASMGDLHNLTTLYLDDNKLSGRIPESFGNLTMLDELSLDNNSLSGTLPFAICELPNVQYVYVSNNRLEGPLPRTLRLDSKLYYMSLSNNSFTGNVPSWLFTRSLRGIGADGNKFSGIEFFHPPNVSYLEDISINNNLIEEIPKSVFLLKKVSVLRLDQNRLTGAFDLNMLKDMEGLTSLNMSWNEGLSLVNSKGSLPTNLKELYFDHCNLTEFPNFLNSLPNLQQLFLIGNKMRGAIDFSKGWDRLRRLDASFNSLEGSLPAPPLSLEYLFLSHNNLIGDVPAGLCHLTELDLSFNRLNGVLQWTPEKCFDSAMGMLNLGNNKLHGSIPEITFTNLRVLLLNRNNFNGKLPRSLANNTFLEYLDVGNNNITDEFPGFLGNLGLRVLVISFNSFKGNMAQINPPKFPYRDSLFSDLLVLDISNNKFTGFLPMEYIQTFAYPKYGYTDELYYGDKISITFNGSKTLISEIFPNETVAFRLLDFSILDLSNNKFSGRIPNGIGDLNQLTGLNLNGNRFSGEIPKSIGKLVKLKSLDISSNTLSGSIPLELNGFEESIVFKYII